MFDIAAIGRDNLAEGLRCLVDLTLHDRRRGPAGEWWGSREHFVDDRAEGVDVARDACRVTFSTLRREVLDGAPDGSGQRRRGITEVLGEAEVGDLCIALVGEENVGWLQVAVDQVLAVSEPDAVSHLFGDVDCLVEREATVLQSVGEGVAGQSLEDNVRACDVRAGLQVSGIHVVAGVVDVDEIGMAQLRGDSCLPVEPAHVVVVAGVLRAQDLDSDVAAEVFVSSGVDLRHGAVPDERTEAESPIDQTPGERAGAVTGRGHAAPRGLGQVHALGFELSCVEGALRIDRRLVRIGWMALAGHIHESNGPHAAGSLIRRW